MLLSSPNLSSFLLSSGSCFACFKDLSSLYSRKQSSTHNLDEFLPTPLEDSSKHNNRALVSALSANGRYLSIADELKRILLFRQYESTWNYVGNLIMQRKVSCMAFMPDDSSIFIGEKSGHVNIHNLADFKTSPDSKNITSEETDSMLGHLSLLSCIVVSSDGRLVGTCDRDGKIRISLAAHPHIIQSFCLGHTGPVHQIIFLDNETLASVGGDGYLRLWNVIEGEELESLDLNLELRKLTPNHTSEADSPFIVSKMISLGRCILLCLNSHNCILSVSLCFSENECKFTRSNGVDAEVSLVICSLAKTLIDFCVIEHTPSEASAIIVGLTEPGTRLSLWKLKIPAHGSPAHWTEIPESISLPDELKLTETPYRLNLLSEMSKCTLDKSGSDAYEKGKSEMHKNIKERHLRHQRKRRLLQNNKSK